MSELYKQLISENNLPLVKKMSMCFKLSLLILSCLCACDHAHAHAYVCMRVCARIRLHTSVCNCSFETGIYFDNLKTSKATPVFREKGSNLECSNYRPISIN